MSINGVDTKTRFATIGAVKEQPELAKFQFRASNRWISGTHNRTTVNGYYGAGQEFVPGGRPPLRRRPPAGTNRIPTRVPRRSSS